MKWLESVRSVAIADIPKPDDWATVLEEERTRWLSVDFKRTQGPVSLPVLHGSTLIIITGTHRIAAMVLGGETHVTCRLFSGDTAEEEFVRTSDNAVPPREDYDAWVDRRVRALSALIEKQRSELGQPVQVGRKTTTTEAREAVARETKSTPEAVRKTQERLEEKRKPKLDVRIVDNEGNEARVAAPAEPPPRPPHIEARDLLKLALDHGNACEDTLWKVFHLLKPMQAPGVSNGKTPIINSALGGAGEAARLVNEALKQARVSVNDLETIEKNLRKANSAPTAGERLPGEGPRRGLGGAKL